jgi:SpoIID/LytB domain protein
MRRSFKRFATVAVACLLVALPASAAHASDGFTFYGSGDGHGLGMSQWGAYGLAQMGWSHRKILRHFYQHTAVGVSSSVPSHIRVGLTWDRTLVHLKALGGPVRLWEGAAVANSLVGRIPAGDTWRVVAKDHKWAVRKADGSLVGGHLWGGPNTNLIITYADAGSRVFIPEADAIWYQGFSYAHGTIEMDLSSCGDANGCLERVIARLGFEDYLLGLGEVPASWPMEAMRAQAVAARTYAAYTEKHYGLRSYCNCDITDGSSDQTYIGYNREAGTDGDRWVSAVRSTAGEVVTYNGAVIQAFYAASDGGHSDSVEDIWHGGNPAYAIPWLTGVCDPGEATAANPWTSWTKRYTTSEATSRLAPYTGSIGTLRRFTHIQRAEGGRIMRAVAVGSTGQASVTGGEMKSAFGWYDQRVWVNTDRTIRGPIRQTYDALGCRPGMPASPVRSVNGGAQQYFANGGLYRNNSQDLTVWLRGPIDAEFRAVHAAGGVLGVPTGTPERISTKSTTCQGCTRASFASGKIYYGPATGAHALWGNVLNAYLAHGGAGGALGMPVSRVLPRAAGGVHASFEHGSIVCVAGDCTVTLG